MLAFSCNDADRARRLEDAVGENCAVSFVESPCHHIGAPNRSRCGDVHGRS